MLSTSLDHAIATSQVTVAEIWDVRRTLELRTAELAAVQRSDGDAWAILGHAEAMAVANRDLDALMAVAVPTACQTRATEDQHQSVVDQHRRLAQTIADRDAPAALDEMNKHFDTSIGDLFERYSEAS